MPFLAFVLKLCREESTVAEDTSPQWDDAQSFLHFLYAHMERCHVQPITMAVLPPHDTLHVSFRITCYETRAQVVISVLTQPISKNSVVHTGHHCYTFESLDLHDPLVAGVSSWADILATDGSAYMRFSFTTPVITKRMNPDTSSFPDALPFPEPLPLFTSLVHRWNALGGPPMSPKVEELVETTGCTISDYRLHTVEVVRQGQTHVGYLGGIEYECQRKNGKALKTLTALTRLAFFAGSGYGIEHRLGATITTILK